MKTKGQSIIELLLVVSLASLIFPTLATSFVSSREGKAQQYQRLEAVSLLTEAEEATRSVRENGWSTFAINGVYHPEIASNAWDLVANEEVINGFTRRVEIADAYRNSSGDLVESGGFPDPSTKKVIITVSWNTPSFTSVSSKLLFSRYLNNLSFIETTEDDFNGGIQTDTVVTNIDNGEITLNTSLYSSWCAPSLSISALDLPKQGVANGITAIEGLVFAGTGNNASGESYAKVDISDTNPPVAVLEGTFSNYKTNEVFGETDYGYIATDTNAKEIVILDISTLPYTEIGFFNSPGPTDSESIFVIGQTGYMVAGNNLYNFDLSSKSGERPIIDPDGITLPGIGKEIHVFGDYAYIAIAGSTTKMQIVDVSNPSNLSLTGFSTFSASDTNDVTINPDATRAYLATSTSITDNEFFIIDISNKNGNRPIIGSYDTNGMDPKGVTTVSSRRAIIVGEGAEEYQVINISNETNPTRCGGFEIDNGINGLASVLETDDDAYSYIITGDANEELKIIDGEPGGEYIPLGIYESATFDAGYQAAFNRFEANGDIPSQTEIRYQMAVTDAVSGSCDSASFTFVGPDGSVDTYFNQNGPIPHDDDGIGYENPGRCFRYKVYLSAEDVLFAPTFYDITFNYSP